MAPPDDLASLYADATEHFKQVVAERDALKVEADLLRAFLADARDAQQGVQRILELALKERHGSA